jgi:adenosine deaminase
MVWRPNGLGTQLDILAPVVIGRYRFSKKTNITFIHRQIRNVMQPFKRIFTDTMAEPSVQSNSLILQFREARFSDLSAIASVWTDAFFDDELIGDIMHPHRKQYPQDIYWFLLRGVRERFWDWRHQFVVVTVKDGNSERIVGAADWRRLGNGGKPRELPMVDPSEWNPMLEMP